MIPDGVLLDIFDFYLNEPLVHGYEKQSIEGWIELAHVCRRWRSVVFQSPHRLNIRLVCTTRTPTRDILDTWPPSVPSVPLIILNVNRSYPPEPFIEDNVVAALEHNDRVCHIELTFPNFGQFANSAAAMLKPFPELTFLRLGSLDRHEEPEPILPDSFLGGPGSTPRLEYLKLEGVSFTGLPRLLLSTIHLVNLDLSFIPRSGYIPPEAMATSLPALTSLKSLSLWFNYPPPRPALETRRPSPPPLTRSILPSLTKIIFKGASEYLEVILARIDAPRLDSLDITFFNQLIFDTPQLFQLICRRPTLRASQRGIIRFNPSTITVNFASQTSDHGVLLIVGIQCTPSEWQLSSLGQVCASSLPTASILEDLYISERVIGNRRLHWQDDVENTLWLDLLRSFVAVKNLYISEKFVPRIVPALQELVGGGTTEVLPALENIFLEGFQPSRPLQEGIEKFVAARLLTGHPVAVSHWDRKRYW
jgi:hypothetical protein